MATFVIVHGALGGGWEWRGVAQRLAVRGHEVMRPTLTGLGERAHLLTPQVDLDTHIQDVLGVLHWDDLEQVILCGHSYGGMVITGVADQAPERLAHLVYIDAFVPTDGQAANDLVPPTFAEAMFRAPAREQGDGWRAPCSVWSRLSGVPDAVADWYAARLTDQSLHCFEQPIRLQSGATAVPRTYIRCSQDPDRGMFGPFAQRAQAEGWPYHVLATEHDVQITDPDGIASLLNDIAERLAAA
jgi:pimeloyl-ACP methyl ester carboxylesterase